MTSRHLVTLLLLLGCSASRGIGEEPVVAEADAASVGQLPAPDGSVVPFEPDATVFAPAMIDATVTPPPSFDAPPRPRTPRADAAPPPPPPSPDAPPPPPPPPPDAPPPPPPKPDAAPPRPDAPPAQWSDRQKCENMCQSYCIHRYNCDGTDVDECRMAIDEADGGTCAERAYMFEDISQERVQACIDAIMDMSCPDFMHMFNTGRGIPSECYGILR